MLEIDIYYYFIQNLHHYEIFDIDNYIDKILKNIEAYRFLFSYNLDVFKLFLFINITLEKIYLITVIRTHIKLISCFLGILDKNIYII
jgi:hypothetical protein